MALVGQTLTLKTPMGSQVYTFDIPGVVLNEAKYEKFYQYAPKNNRFVRLIIKCIEDINTKVEDYYRHYGYVPIWDTRFYNKHYDVPIYIPKLNTDYYEHH